MYMFQLLKFVYSQVVFVFCDIKLIIFATVTVFDQSAMVCLLDPQTLLCE